MDAFLSSLRAEGQLDSSGTFSINRLRVSELMENAQKGEASLYFLKAIQAAVASGSPRVDLKLLSSAVRVIFYPPESVADQVQALFHEGGVGIAEYVRWSVHCALAAGVRNVRCRLSGPEAQDNVEFVFQAEGSTVEPLSALTPTRRVELAFEGFRATSEVKTLVGLYERIRLHHCVSRSCGFSLTPIYLDGYLREPDLGVLMAPGALILSKLSRSTVYAFNVLRLGRRDPSRQRHQIATIHPMRCWPSAVICRNLVIPNVRELNERRPFHLLNLPESPKVVFQENRELVIVPGRKQGNYESPTTLRLIHKMQPARFTSSKVVRHYGLADCGDCLDGARVIGQCHIVGSLEVGLGSYLYVVKDGVLLRPLPFEYTRKEVIAVLADPDVKTDASGLSPIYDEYFEGLVEIVRGALREALD